MTMAAAYGRGESAAATQQRGQVRLEARVADRGGLHAPYIDALARGEAGDRAKHRYPVIAVGVDRAAAKATATLDPHPVLARLDRCAERGQRLAGRGDAIRLLAPQLGGIADRRLALGETGRQGDQRQLVDRQRDLPTADLGAAQLRGTRANRSDRLAALLSDRLDLDLGAHPPEH